MAGTKPEILFCTLGTRGDVAPFLALSEPFLADDFSVTFLTNENWRELVLSYGANFHPIARADPPQDSRDDLEFFEENIFPSFAATFDYIARKAKDGIRCVIIHRTNMLGAECAAHVLGYPCIKIALQPSAVPSRRQILRPLTMMGYRAPPERLMVFGGALLSIFNGKYRRLNNRFRASVGVPKVPPWRMPSDYHDLMFVACPEWFAMPQTDWPTRCYTIGFPFEKKQTLERKVEDFIAQNGPPLVFAAGTGNSKPEAFFSRALEICAALKSPAVFLGSNDIPVPKTEVPLLTWPFVDFSSLLPKARLLVHHGGIGTVAQAIRAGIPQLVLPDRFDQPDNASRVALFGLGAAILDKDAPVNAIVKLTRELLSNEEIAKQLKVAASLVLENNAADSAYCWIKTLICEELSQDRPLVDAA
jgi:UDP:flavonoid glycosyltransferase YjiC (YdhE family)